MGKSRKIFLLAKEQPKSVTSKFDPNPAAIAAREHEERSQAEAADRRVKGAKASSARSIAVKESPKTSSTRSVAVKEGPKASSARSVAVKEGPKSSSARSVAVKEGPKASSARSVAVKEDPKASSTRSVAVKEGPKASSARSVAVRKGPKASSTRSVAVREGAKETSPRAVAVRPTQVPASKSKSVVAKQDPLGTPDKASPPRTVAEPTATEVPAETPQVTPQPNSSLVDVAKPEAPQDDVFWYVPSEEPVFREDRRYLWLSEKSKVRGHTGSAHRLLLKTIARAGNFQRVEKILEFGKFDPKDMAQAKGLLKMMAVRRDTIEPMMRAQAEWQSHADTRANQIRARAEHGNEKAKATISNPNRVDGGKWVGNVGEMVSVNCGSYKPAWQRARGVPAGKRRDSNKLAEGQVVVRKFPRRGTQKLPACVMIFPEKHFEDIEKAIMTVYGIDERPPANSKENLALEQVETE